VNIRGFSKIKDELEFELDKFSSEIEERWKGLIGAGYGYFNGWNLDGEIICISYCSPGGVSDVDKIPIQFFEIENQEEAITQFRLYRKEEDSKDKANQVKKREEEERALLEKLKKKYEAKEDEENKEVKST
jgi:hypothetical protein